MRITGSLTVRVLSWMFLAAGAFFLVYGVRELVWPLWSQHHIAAKWEVPKVASEPAPPAVAPEEGGPVCRLAIPRLNAEWFVVEGTGAKDLRLGPGHMTGTALPGTSGNCIIAGHRDTQFRVLKDLRKGDEIVLQTSRGDFRYRVNGMNVVASSNNRPLAPGDKPILSLITCYPFYYVGPAPKRFVAVAQLEDSNRPSGTGLENEKALSEKPAAAPQVRVRAARSGRHAKMVRTPQRDRAAMPPKHPGLFKRIVNRLKGRAHKTSRDAS
ncbi:MAG: class D sortase [Bryobacteraceae bacterium]